MQGELLSSDSERTADFDTPARASSTSSTGSRGKPRQLRYGAAANRGPRRTMEDAHIAVSPFWDADLQQAAKPGAQATLEEPCQGFFAVSLHNSTACLRCGAVLTLRLPVVALEELRMPMLPRLQHALVAACTRCNIVSMHAALQVFDGHGGVAAAQFASKHIVSFVTSDRGFPEDLGAALVSLEQQAFQSCEGCAPLIQGSKHKPMHVQGRKPVPAERPCLRCLC